MVREVKNKCFNSKAEKAQNVILGGKRYGNILETCSMDNVVRSRQLTVDLEKEMPVLQ